jgi:hypothetical protein
VDKGKKKPSKTIQKWLKNRFCTGSNEGEFSLEFKLETTFPKSR